ncbi:MAG: HAD family hydrolase [Oceanospirillaceae bacterium]|uniref:HAD family hydrolase n=1 Tax=unclassified Thalassolituus TaxID=2624967 RepID=UPI000C609CB0|nr:MULTISPECIES: HAD-IA family hydrolase [unclassified Thalassolituus]MAS25455.1 HAD family hydrolase [Oceanospirillaceae bacterium]MAX98992.1 HAD family hydrolase [Oceanospirillaceae bacterium]MBS53267.1 HAD family hydrolase [Oceanospirillaceae bacterium]|tara:strand:+ start:385 stop:1068 length:684 start_codon:yes stop_codon:yes gene_type:complete
MSHSEAPLREHKYRLVIFDWDGTLVDSTRRIVDSMQRAGRKVGLAPVPDEAIQDIIGLGLPEALKTVWPDITDEQLPLMRDTYASYFVSDSQVGMGFYEGAREMLGALLAQGYLLAVATGKSRKGLNRMLRDLEVGHLFEATRCADETRSKPDPMMLHELLSALSVAPGEAVMVGDTTYDLEMAQRTGIDSIGMGHGAHDEARLLACGPQTICHSINELKNWIMING